MRTFGVRSKIVWYVYFVAWMSYAGSRLVTNKQTDKETAYCNPCVHARRALIALWALTNQHFNPVQPLPNMSRVSLGSFVVHVFWPKIGVDFEAVIAICKQLNRQTNESVIRVGISGTVLINNKYKNNWIKLKNEVWMAGSKSTQIRDNHIYYLYIPTLAFLDYYASINVDAFVECGMWEIFRLFPSCHKGLSLSVLIQSYIITDYFVTFK